MPPLLDVTIDSKKKPIIFKLYDYQKGGIDIVDQKIGYNSCKERARHRMIVAFSYLLHTCRENASTVLAKSRETDLKKENTFQFGWQLAMDLIRSQCQSRTTVGLQYSNQRKIEAVFRQQISAI